MNIRNHHVYSDKLVLGVVELNHTELATEEDKQYGIDYWAKLFKARTWEGNMKNPYMEDFSCAYLFLKNKYAVY